MNNAKTTLNDLDDWKPFIDQVTETARKQLEALRNGYLSSVTIPDTHFHQVMDDLWRKGANNLQARFPQQNDLVRKYYLKKITPMLQESVFWHRCASKPRGYAGDYLMMDMIYSNRSLSNDGAKPFVTQLDRWFLNTPVAQACRHRHEWLADKLTFGCANGVRRIASLACGPCRELATFLERQGDLRHPIEVDLVDFDTEALDYARRLLEPRLGSQVQLEFQQINLLKAIRQSGQIGQPEQYDLIYCSGFADYLGAVALRRLLKCAYELLKPGGILLLAQFLERDNHPDRSAMQWGMDWNLVYRTEGELQAAFAHSPFGNQVQIEAESLGLIAFCEARR